MVGREQADGETDQEDRLLVDMERKDKEGERREDLCVCVCVCVCAV